MQKQIEEMAEILLEASRQTSTDRSNNKAYTMFGADTIFKYGCDRLNGAAALYNADYRKQEWHDVSDPPKTSGLYIVYTDKGGKCTARYYADSKKFRVPFGRNAKYWTFMPEDPKEG